MSELLVFDEDQFPKRLQAVHCCYFFGEKKYIFSIFKLALCLSLFYRSRLFLGGSSVRVSHIRRDR